MRQFLFFSLLYLFIFVTLTPKVVAQEFNRSSTNDTSRLENTFLMLLWPEKGGLLSEAPGEKALLNALNNAWYDSHLPSHTGMSLDIHIPQTQSLQNLARLIENTWPDCIEGDRWFIEEEINQGQFSSLNQRKYIPILMRSTDRTTAELIFRSRAMQWEGRLGVIHPSYEIGGKLQIAKWNETTQSQANWIAFHSSDEVLRQFFIGSCSAAAVPHGALESFLKKYDKEHFAQRLKRIKLEKQGYATTFFLRKDLYDNFFMRTLITETWLRNHFSGQFIPLPSSWPYNGEVLIKNNFE